MSKFELMNTWASSRFLLVATFCACAFGADRDISVDHGLDLLGRSTTGVTYRTNDGGRTIVHHGHDIFGNATNETSRLAPGELTGKEAATVAGAVLVIALLDLVINGDKRANMEELQRRETAVALAAINKRAEEEKRRRQAEQEAIRARNIERRKENTQKALGYVETYNAACAELQHRGHVLSDEDFSATCDAVMSLASFTDAYLQGNRIESGRKIIADTSNRRAAIKKEAVIAGWKSLQSRTISLADSGDAASQNAIAMQYASEGPVEIRDLGMAKRYWRMAANGNSGAAFHNLGTIMEGDKDFQGAAANYRAAISLGVLESHYNLARLIYLKRTIGDDIDTAITIWTKAAEMGCKKSQLKLSRLYFFGDGVDESREKAEYFGRMITNRFDLLWDAP